MREVAPGLWDWQTPHPDWDGTQPFAQEVGSHALDDGERLLLFDPLGVPGQILELAASRDVAIVLTAPWHERDTQQLVAQLDAPVYAAHPDTVDDLVATYNVDAEEYPDFVSSDLRWLIHEGGGQYHPIAAGDAPFGLEAFAGRTRNDLIFWVDGVRAVIAGDSLADWGAGIAIQSKWLSANVTREDVAARLRPLLERPVDVVLPAHGTPTDRAALERALA